MTADKNELAKALIDGASDCVSVQQELGRQGDCPASRRQDACRP